MDCSCSCEIDYDNPTGFHRTSIYRAKKKYRCCECHEDILPGKRYQYVVGVWGELLTYRTCMTCVNIREQLCPHGWIYEELNEVVYECFGIGLTEVPEEEE